MTTPTTMYEAEYWHGKINSITVTKINAKLVMVSGHKGKTYRCHLQTQHSGIFHTWEEAHAALLARAGSELHDARLRLQQAQGKMGNIVGMKKPDDLCYTDQTPTALNSNGS